MGGGEADDPGDLRRRCRERDGQREGRLQVGRLVAPVRLAVRGVGGEAEPGQGRPERREERLAVSRIGHGQQDTARAPASQPRYERAVGGPAPSCSRLRACAGQACSVAPPSSPSRRRSSPAWAPARPGSSRPPVAASAILPGAVDRTSLAVEARYDVRMTLRLATGTIAVTEVITIANRSGGPIDRLELNSVLARIGSLRITAATVDGRAVRPVVSDQTIRLPLGASCHPPPARRSGCRSAPASGPGSTPAAGSSRRTGGPGPRIAGSPGSAVPGASTGPTTGIRSSPPPAPSSASRSRPTASCPSRRAAAGWP